MNDADIVLISFECRPGSTPTQNHSFYSITPRKKPQYKPKPMSSTSVNEYEQRHPPNMRQWVGYRLGFFFYWRKVSPSLFLSLSLLAERGGVFFGFFWGPQGCERQKEEENDSKRKREEKEEA